MNAEPYVSRILDDEGIVGDLEGDAAEQLVGWLVHSAERSRLAGRTDAIARSAIDGSGPSRPGHRRRSRQTIRSRRRRLAAMLEKEPKAD